MRKALPILLFAACVLSGCKSSTSTASSAGAPSNGAAKPNDPVEQKLVELAGRGAKSCGVLKSQAASEMDAAGKCALDAAQAKQPFYVEYQLPGMNVAVAGDAQGKLFSVQSQAGGAGLVSGECPAEPRVAPSGRVTCHAPGTFPMGAGAGSHSSMEMPSMGGASPHSGSRLPPGHPDPNQSQKSAPPPKQP
jgi:hypothetical protein